MLEIDPILDSDVPDILLAFANGIEKHIKTHCSELDVNRDNYHDAQVSRAAIAFAPLLVLTLQNTKLLYINIGSQRVELWDHSNVTSEKGDGNSVNHDIIPTRHLSYSDPGLLDQLVVMIKGHFRI